MQFAFRRPSGARSSAHLLRLTTLVLCLLAAAACGGSDASQTSSETGTPTGPAPPRTTFPMPPVNNSGSAAAANSQSFTLLDNRRARISDYQGQVVVLDFYATWCGPCRIETPHLVEMHRRYSAKGLRIIGLNVGGPQDRGQVPAYVEEFRIPYMLGYPDPAMTQLYLSDDDRIPQAFVFDRKGRLVKRFISYDDSMPAELERIIQASLAAPAD
ncbi:MAG: TlpA family protein disulfide reductase [Acidobacteria bacterium]|nr:TlpA family protein disulfide reductase [Acidobacteriota bacterium]